jgi:hypothetical protein
MPVIPGRADISEWRTYTCKPKRLACRAGNEIRIVEYERVRVEENTLKSLLRTSLVAGVIVLGLASLPRYTLMHRDARHSQPELERIYQWARGERRRLKSLAAGAATSVDAAANQ